MSKLNINEQVIVTALGFRKNLISYPRRIEYRGVTHSFIDAGLRCLIRHGGKIIEVITLSDGKAEYHLRRYDNSGGWTLLSIAS